MAGKNNPLFVDSTKFHGDLIATQIELRKIMLYDDETVFVVITNHQGDSKRIQMKQTEEGYEAKVHLNHQTLVTYRFVIEKGGKNFMYSESFKGRARYAIIEEWKPTEEIPAEIPAEPVTGAALNTAGHLNSTWPREQAMGIRNLIDKWGF
jgi:hypothetical protein